MNTKQREALLSTLKARFEKNMSRHKGVEWSKVQARLESLPDKLRSLDEMEKTGGEPDVVGHDKNTGEFVFVIVLQRVLLVAEAFAMTGRGWSPGRNTSLPIAPRIWLQPWVLRSWRKSSIETCRSWAASTQRRQVG